MLTFGIIKGFLRRVYCHPVWLDHPVFSASSASPSRRRETSQDVAPDVPDAAGSSGDEHHVHVPPSLPALLDGKHHTDELCLRYRMNCSRLMHVLAKIGGCESPEAGLGRVQLLYL